MTIATRASSLLAILFAAACARPAVPPPRVAAATCLGIPAATVPGDWLLGSWKGGHWQIAFSRRDGGIAWRAERETFLSPRFGQKSAVVGSGIVSSVSDCTVEADGIYDLVEKRGASGHRLRFELGRKDADHLNGRVIGMVDEYFPVALRREPAR